MNFRCVAAFIVGLGWWIRNGWKIMVLESVVLVSFCCVLFAFVDSSRDISYVLISVLYWGSLCSEHPRIGTSMVYYFWRVPMYIRFA